MRRGAPSPLDLTELAKQLGTKLAPEPIFQARAITSFAKLGRSQSLLRQAYQAASVVGIDMQPLNQ